MLKIADYFRPSVLALKPYSSARDDFEGNARVCLDANENPFNSPLNRYPDPHHRALKKKIAELKKVDPDCIFLGNGSDEVIDVVIRASCEPVIHEIISIDPTYGMYEVAAAVNNVPFKKVRLYSDYSLDADALIKASGPSSRLLFLCSPNNPTSNSFDTRAIEKVIRSFPGLVIVDEAYIDFSVHPGFLQRLPEFPNLIIFQTLSKAWGLAGVRLGMAFATPEIIAVLNKIKYPYNISSLNQKAALEKLMNPSIKDNWVNILLKERKSLAENLAKLDIITKVFPSDANFLLVKTTDPRGIYHWLVERSVIVRDRSSVSLCEGCLRITVGSKEENGILVNILKEYENIKR
ncbi:MAG: histidinol-phosphate transaminase [Bacteroidales bacterium]|nr:histidinol-phosphate transaminase [Bacteroidales bacterium]